jgi:hypothetical protein
MIAFAGTYSIEGDRLVFHIEISWNESWTGHKHPRSFLLAHDRLTLTTDPRPSAFDGRESVYTQVWEKLRVSRSSYPSFVPTTWTDSRWA